MWFFKNLLSDRATRNLLQSEAALPEFAVSLRQEHPLTYSSWRNRKHECRKGQGVWSAEFEDFGDFFEHVGPRPGPEWTLDRIDNSNPTYGPGLVRWANKRGQANNRSTTIFLSVAGETLPLTEWADRTCQNSQTMRARRDRGWTDQEIVQGFRLDGAGRFGNVYHFNFWPEVWPDEPATWRWWEDRYHAVGASKRMPRIAFLNKEARSEMEVLKVKISSVPEADFGRSELALIDKLSKIRTIYKESTKIEAEARREYNAQKRRLKRSGISISLKGWTIGNPIY